MGLRSAKANAKRHLSWKQQAVSLLQHLAQHQSPQLKQPERSHSRVQRLYRQARKVTRGKAGFCRWQLKVVQRQSKCPSQLRTLGNRHGFKTESPGSGPYALHGKSSLVSFDNLRGDDSIIILFSNILYFLYFLFLSQERSEPT